MLFGVLTSMRNPKAGGPAFEFRCHHQHSGCPVLRVLCEGREPETLAQVRIRCRRLKRNLRPAFIHSHGPGLKGLLEPTLARQKGGEPGAGTLILIIHGFHAADVAVTSDAVTNSSRSALIRSACVVGIPC